MKIIKTAAQAQKLEDAMAKANKGCDTCPCCGNRDSFYGFGKHIPSDGIISGISFTDSRGRTVDVYKCPKCNAEWESDPY